MKNMMLLCYYKRWSVKIHCITAIFFFLTTYNLQAGESLVGIGGTWERTFSRDYSQSTEAYSLHGLHPSFNYYYLGEFIDLHVFYHSPLALATLYQDSSDTVLGAENFIASQMIGTSIGTGIDVLDINPIRLRLSGGVGFGLHLYADEISPQNFVVYTQSNAAFNYAPYSLLNIGTGLDISAILFFTKIQDYQPFLSYNVMGIVPVFHSTKIDSSSVQLKDIFYTGNTFQVGVSIF